MSNKSSFILKDLPKSGTLECANLYVMNTTVYYASVHEPKLKYQSDQKEFAMTLFVSEETKDGLLDEAMVNKSFLQVGKDKTSRAPRKIKYPLSSQVEEGKANYDLVDGLYGFGVAKAEFSKKGNKMSVNVIDKEGKPLTDNIGNGSVCNVKCFSYRNQDGQLVISIDTVQVLELVAYEGSTGGAGVVEDSVFGVSYELQKAEDTASEASTPQAAPTKQKAVAQEDDTKEDLLPF